MIDIKIFVSVEGGEWRVEVESPRTIQTNSMYSQSRHSRAAVLSVEIINTQYQSNIRIQSERTKHSTLTYKGCFL